MNALEFVKYYKYDDRLVTGEYYPSESIQAKPEKPLGWC